MSERPEITRFASSEELLKHLRELSDDIDLFVIPVQAGVETHGPDGRRLVQRNVGALLKLCSGRTIYIHRDDAAMLLNDGILQRMNIRCKLDTLEGS